MICFSLQRCLLILFAVSLLVYPGWAQSTGSNHSRLPLEVRQPYPAPSENPNSIRVVSFNVHLGADPDGLAASIRRNANLCQADIFLLQELESYPSEESSRAAELAQRLELNYVYAPARKKVENGEEGTHGLAILSRYPLSEIQVIPLPQFDLRYNTRQRIALAATVEIGSNALRLYNTHLDTRINAANRLEQLEPVLKAAQQDGHAIEVVGGDFNTNSIRWAWSLLPVFYSRQARAVDEFMEENGFTTVFADAGPTMKKGLFRFRLDSLYTRGARVRVFAIEESVDTSDHLPLWIDIVWPPQPPPAEPAER